MNKLEGDGIRGYNISDPALEYVFLGLAKEVKADMQDTSVITLQAGVSPKDMDGLPLSDASSPEDKGLRCQLDEAPTCLGKLGSYSANELPSYAAIICLTVLLLWFHL